MKFGPITLNIKKTEHTCESTNHTKCYGDTWQCAGCKRTMCQNEGAADDHFELCDDCWAKATGNAGKAVGST